MTDIIYTNLESAAWGNIYDILNNRSIISDPRNRSSDKAFVYDSDPVLHKSGGFSGFPYIILSLPTLEYSRISEDGRFKQCAWKHRIVIRTAKDGSANSRVDVGRTDMFQICDALQQAMNSLSVKNTLSISGINNLKLTKVNNGIVILDQKMLYESEYDLEYNQRIQVA